LVISHDSKPQHDTSLSFVSALDVTERSGVTSGGHIDEDAWRIGVLDEVIEPVLMAYDYKTLLAEASGRIIVLSNFAQGPSSRLILHPNF
jgi:hypothetical protein